MNRNRPKLAQKGPKRDRKAQAKWDRQHLRTVSTKLDRATYEELKAVCDRWNMTPYAVLRRLLITHVVGRSLPWDVEELRRSSPPHP